MLSLFLFKLETNFFHGQNIYTIDSPFYDYHYWPQNPWNRDTRKSSSYVQFIWATDYWNSDPRNEEDP